MFSWMDWKKEKIQVTKVRNENGTLPPILKKYGTLDKRSMNKCEPKIGQARRNRQIPRNTKPTETKSQRNRKSEYTYNS